jgi:hypothetical protein
MQVIGGRLASIAAEMSQKMIRMSFSILIKESEDIGCAITDAAGNQLAEADTSPLQMGPIPFYVRGAKRILAERGEEIGRATSSCTIHLITAPRTHQTSACSFPCSGTAFSWPLR